VSVLPIAESGRAEAIAEAIEGFQNFACALACAHSVAAASALLQETEFQAVLVGSGNRDNLESEVAILRRALPDVAVIALPESDDALQAQRLIQAGADGVTPIGTARAGLERALATALQRAALGRRMRTNNPARVRGYVDEGKMLVLELMGYLVSFYRSHAIGMRRRPTAQKVANAAG
jgi:DNA-binding NarL/FixJ family response regulator